MLLKSDLPEAVGLDDLAQANYVDEFFPVIAANIRQVRCVNLRDNKFAERTFPAEV